MHFTGPIAKAPKIFCMFDFLRNSFFFCQVQCWVSANKIPHFICCNVQQIPESNLQHASICVETEANCKHNAIASIRKDFGMLYSNSCYEINTICFLLGIKTESESEWFYLPYTFTLIQHTHLRQHNKITILIFLIVQLLFALQCIGVIAILHFMISVFLVSIQNSQ